MTDMLDLPVAVLPFRFAETEKRPLGEPITPEHPDVTGPLGVPDKEDPVRCGPGSCLPTDAPPPCDGGTWRCACTETSPGPNCGETSAPPTPAPAVAPPMTPARTPGAG